MVTDETGNIIEKLNLYRDGCRRFSVVSGFDGFIDRIFRVVETRQDSENYTTYRNISGFADRIRAAAGLSADIELILQEERLGGNAPIMANALSGYGICTTCIGTMGYPDVNSLFNIMQDSCNILSIGEPAVTQAFEFNDGKLMFADLSPFNGLDWDRLKSLIDFDLLSSLFCNSDLIALTNWSLIQGMSDIWEGLSQELLGQRPEGSPNTKVFFDLADPSKRTTEDIMKVLDIISGFSGHSEVTLGLNENEARCIYSAIKKTKAGAVNPGMGINGYVNLGAGIEGYKDRDQEDLLYIAETIYEHMSISALVVHPLDRCIGICGAGVYEKKGHIVEKPVVTTGGGDNFNAGFCLGWLLGMNMPECMILAMAASRLYVKNGVNPTIDKLINGLDKVM